MTVVLREAGSFGIEGAWYFLVECEAVFFSSPTMGGVAFVTARGGERDGERGAESAWLCDRSVSTACSILLVLAVAEQDAVCPGADPYLAQQTSHHRKNKKRAKM